MTLAYDGNGYIASRTDSNGNVVNMVNNIYGLPTSIVEAAGTARARTTTLAYHLGVPAAGPGDHAGRYGGVYLRTPTESR